MLRLYLEKFFLMQNLALYFVSDLSRDTYVTSDQYHVSIRTKLETAALPIFLQTVKELGVLKEPVVQRYKC